MLFPAETALLIGSGISVPSGLPSGMSFNKRIVEILAANGSETRTLSRLMTLDDSDVGLGKIRFEQLLGILRETIDSDLRILDVFDRDAEPNPLHFIAARAMHAGSRVATTNFDSLLELAYYTEHESTLAIACMESARGPLQRFSFSAQSRGQRSPAILKLHGTLSVRLGSERGAVLKSLTLRHSLGATLDSIGSPDAGPRLERHKHRALSEAIRGRTLVVMGYSGLDDFDVVPSLVSAISGCQRILWVSHAENRQPKRIEPRSVVPAALVEAAAKNGVAFDVIRGRTEAIARRFFPQFSQAIPTGGRIHDAVLELSLPHDWRAFIVGRLLQHTGRYRMAARRYGRAASLTRITGDRRCRAEALEWKASALFEVGDTDNAAKTNVAAMKSWRAIGDFAGHAATVLDRARILLRKNRVRDAAAACLAAKALARNRLDIRVEALLQEADCRRTLGEIPKAVVALRQALRLSRILRNRQRQASALNKLAQAEKENGRLPVALKLSRRARRLYGLVGSKAGVAGALATEGGIYLQKGNALRAHASYKAALKVLRDTNRDSSIATMLEALGVCCRMVDRDRKALTYFGDALAINRRIRNGEGIARNTENIALSLIKAGRLAEARHCLGRSRRAHLASGNRQKLGITLNNLSECWRREGKLDQARAVARQALKVNNRIKRRRGIASVLENLGRIEMQVGHLGVARRLALKAYVIASTDGYNEVVVDTANLLASLSETHGDMSSARNWRRIAGEAVRRRGTLTSASLPN